MRPHTSERASKRMHLDCEETKAAITKDQEQEKHTGVRTTSAPLAAFLRKTPSVQNRMQFYAQFGSMSTFIVSLVKY